MSNDKFSKEFWLKCYKELQEEKYTSNFADPSHVINTTPDSRIEDFEKQYGAYPVKEATILDNVTIISDTDDRG